tara:strand:+ start:316 stop:948 length:633 start_codon:yes stop_codon:yes gene_type:complete
MLNKFKNYYCPSYLYAITCILLGYMAFQYHCQHKVLSDSIKLYDTNIKLYQGKLDELREHHNKMFHLCDSLIHIMDSLPLGSPLDTLIISSNFGSRKNSETQKWEYHPGVDFLADWRDTVYATGAGIIEKSGHINGYGRTIVISHVSGYRSRYAHLTRCFVREGNPVKRGDPIGTAGNSGHSRGYHLHYEIMRVHGGLNSTSNPKDYIIL